MQGRGIYWYAMRGDKQKPEVGGALMLLKSSPELTPKTILRVTSYLQYRTNRMKNQAEGTKSGSVMYLPAAN